MSFDKVGDYPSALDARYHNAVWNNGKLWLFSQTHVDQPTFNWGHHVSFAGGYSTFFDTEANQWDAEGKKPFPAVSDKENAEEFAFAFRTQIFLMLYSHFGAVEFLSLYKFDEKQRAWAKDHDIEPDNQPRLTSTESATTKHTLILVDGEDDVGRYFVSFVDHKIQILRLRLAGDLPKVETVVEVPDDANIRRITPTSAALIGNHVLISGGSHGCGFRWDSAGLIRVNLADKSAKWIDVDTKEAPTFSYSGARRTAVSKSGKAWLHITGSTAQGMTGSRWNGDVWALTDAETEQPKWKKTSLSAPKPEEDAVVAFDATKDVIYMAGKGIGVVKGKIAV